MNLDSDNSPIQMKPFLKKWLLPILVLAITISLAGYSNRSDKQKHIEMKSLKIGDSIPIFILPDQNGVPFEIRSVIGKKKLVLFFYPKDDSPGCTKEACYFRDLYEVFSEADAVIIGISGQSVESHKMFAEKHRLSYTLLSDSGNKIRKQFGVPTDLFGLLPGRVTYIADKNGKVVHIFNSQSQTERHVDESLKILKELK